MLNRPAPIDNTRLGFIWCLPLFEWSYGSTVCGLSPSRRSQRLHLGPRIGEVVGGAGLRALPQRPGSGVPSRAPGWRTAPTRGRANRDPLRLRSDRARRRGSAQSSVSRPQGLAGAAAAQYQGGILLNEHVAEDGPTVFEHACRLGAEGIVSKKVDGTYRSGPCPVWIKVRNPASVAVQRERSENWNR